MGGLYPKHNVVISKYNFYSVVPWKDIIQYLDWWPLLYDLSSLLCIFSTFNIHHSTLFFSHHLVWTLLRSSPRPSSPSHPAVTFDLCVLCSDWRLEGREQRLYPQETGGLESTSLSTGLYRWTHMGVIATLRLPVPINVWIGHIGYWLWSLIMNYADKSPLHFTLIAHCRTQQEAVSRS